MSLSPVAYDWNKIRCSGLKHRAWRFLHAIALSQVKNKIRQNCKCHFLLVTRSLYPNNQPITHSYYLTLLWSILLTIPFNNYLVYLWCHCHYCSWSRGQTGDPLPISFLDQWMILVFLHCSLNYFFLCCEILILFGYSMLDAYLHIAQHFSYLD